MAELCLTLLCPSAVEENLLDVLLMLPSVAVFTSAPTAAHGLHAARLSQAEQVLGRAFATQVQVVFAEADKETVFATIQNQFAGAGLRYWLSPVIEAGEFK
jgi:hypothetical protein